MISKPKLGIYFHNNLDKISNKEVEELKTLPLSHSCDVADLEAIINSEKIEASYQSNLDDKLSFFFYGKPSFHNKKWLLPICLLFNPDEAIKFSGIAPFDTGGFENNYKQVFSPGSLIVNQFINKEDIIGLSYPKKIIFKFFNRSNLDYMNNKINYSGDIKELNAAGYYYNTLSKFPHSGDERKFTIELQLQESYSIRSNKLIFAFLPLCIYQEVEDYLKEMNPQLNIAYYTPETAFLDGGYQAILGSAKNAVLTFLKDGNYL